MQNLKSFDEFVIDGEAFDSFEAAWDRINQYLKIK